MDKSEDLAKLISQTTQIPQILSQRPLEKLVPWLPQLRSLAADFERLSRAAEAHQRAAFFSMDMTSIAGSKRRSASPIPLSKIPKASRTSEAPSDNDVAPDRERLAAMETLTLAMSGMADIEAAMLSLPEIPDISHDDPRLAHIKNIFDMQKRKASGEVRDHDKILLLCSCQSLARDFRAFEVKNGWMPKQDQIAEPILRGVAPSVQKVGKHFQDYVSAIPLEAADKQKLDAGLRLGMKLEVMEKVGRTLGVGPSLALLLGFECVKFSRLSYKAFPALSTCMQSDPSLMESLRVFSNKIDHPWRKYQMQYETRYGATRDLRHASPTSAVSDPTGMHSNTHNIPFSFQFTGHGPTNTPATDSGIGSGTLQSIEYEEPDYAMLAHGTMLGMSHASDASDDSPLSYEHAPFGFIPNNPFDASAYQHPSIHSTPLLLGALGTHVGHYNSSTPHSHP